MHWGRRFFRKILGVGTIQDPSKPEKNIVPAVDVPLRLGRRRAIAYLGHAPPQTAILSVLCEGFSSFERKVIKEGGATRLLGGRALVDGAADG